MTESYYDPTRVPQPKGPVDESDLRPTSERYEILGEPLRGGMGLVYPANDATLSRHVAIKRIRPEFIRDHDFLIRFRKEATAMAALNHPNLVSVFDLMEDDHGPMIVMQWVNGRSVSELLKLNPKFPPDKAAAIVKQVALAMQVVHDAGILHRDLKPANILVEKTLKAYVTDFGLARLEAKKATLAGETITGALLGTVDFISPEQLGDPKKATVLSDIWSLGATFYQMLTGQSVRGMRTDRIPETYQDIILTALEFAPGDRFQSMEEFANSLTKTGTGQQTRTAKKSVTNAAESRPQAPQASTGRSIADRWKQKAATQTNSRQQAIHLAESQHDYAAAVKLLESVDQPLRDKKLLAQYKTAVTNIDQLKQTIEHCVETFQTTGLRRALTEILQLQPQRSDLQELLDSLGPLQPRPDLLNWPFDASTARTTQTNWAGHLDLPGEIENSLGMKFRVLPPGTFQMGSPEGEEERYDDEPLHEVTLTRPSLLGVYPVTQGQWTKLMGSNPSHFTNVQGESTDRFPVEQVSWEDCEQFLVKLNQQHLLPGWRYRLPTEAEWEYACRAGSTTPFWFGSTLNGTEANCNGEFPYPDDHEDGPYLGRPCVAGSYQANPFGLYDTHGNVWEWCSDWYDSDYYGESPAQDPRGPSVGSSRVLRGSSWDGLWDLSWDLSWDHDASGCRSACRNNNDPSLRSSQVGFRVLCELV